MRKWQLRQKTLQGRKTAGNNVIDDTAWLVTVHSQATGIFSVWL